MNPKFITEIREKTVYEHRHYDNDVSYVQGDVICKSDYPNKEGCIVSTQGSKMKKAAVLAAHKAIMENM